MCIEISNNGGSHMKNIVLQICADNEWIEVKKLFLNEKFKTSPFGEYFILPKIFSRADGQVEYRCIIFKSGATKTLSAAACQYAICVWHPDIIFVMGTACGIGPNIEPLDIIFADLTVQYDCISRMGEDSELFCKEFEVIINNPWLRKVDKNEFPFKFSFGTIATADQDVDKRTRDILFPHEIKAADWESGAIAPICKLNKTSCCIVRGISDVPGKNGSKYQFSQFSSNTPLVMEKLITKVLPNILDAYLKYPVST